MKDITESSHRRLIRPSLDDVKGQMSRRKKPPRGHRQKRSGPPHQTNAESFYYVKQMQNRTPMVVVLCDGEQLIGTIEWYDLSCLKLSRAEGPNLLIYKSGIKYIYKRDGTDCGETENTVNEEMDSEKVNGANGHSAANGHVQEA